VAHVNDQIDSARLVEFTGGLLLSHGIGAAIGPVVAGVAMDIAGPSSLMLYYTAVMGSLALYAIKRLRAAPAAVPTEEKADFVLMGGGSQAVLQMDPRTPPDASSGEAFVVGGDADSQGPSGMDKPLP
jgi:hypothetical protein